MDTNSDLAAEKKRAEVVADEDFVMWESLMSRYFDGTLNRGSFMQACLNMQQSHNTERGLRHEK